MSSDTRHEGLPQGSAERARGHFRLVLLAVPVALYLLLCGSYLQRIRHADGGHLVYALDDPYIHLALADQIAKGHYGINPGEAASPSSSILWPFLLAPFAHWSHFVWAPLLLNGIAGVLVALLIGSIVADWPGTTDGWDERFRRLLSVCLLLFVGNLVCLTFIGMEHNVQVLLAGCAAYAITCVLSGRPVPGIVLCGVALGPVVRYEALGLTLAVALALAGRRQIRAAVILLAAGIIPLLAFSLFLHHLGLPWLPTSVLVKGGVSEHVGLLQRFAQLVVSAFMSSLTQRDRLLLLVLFLALVDLAFRQRTTARRTAVGAAALAAGLHLLVGQFNWFHRYEVYIVYFSTLVVLRLVFEQPRFIQGWYALGLLACAWPYLDGTRTLIAATQDIYLQQYQMHRFSTKFYHGNVAVNDLGLVSFGRPEGQQVLDLVGLGSAEAAQQPVKTAAWLQAVTERHHAGLAMIYNEWFTDIPSGWTPIGSLCLVRPPIMLSHSCVAFYATTAGDPAAIQNAFHAWAATLPAGVTALDPATARTVRGEAGIQ